MSGEVRVIETETATGERRYVPNTKPLPHGGWSLNYTAQDAANEVSFRNGHLATRRHAYEIAPVPELNTELARDEDDVLCRYCVPAHGTIAVLLSCRCVAQCGGDGCTGALLLWARSCGTG